MFVVLGLHNYIMVEKFSFRCLETPELYKILDYSQSE